jgi:hypothetical protein
MGNPGLWPRLEKVNEEIKIHQVLIGQIFAVDATWPMIEQTLFSTFASAWHSGFRVVSVFGVRKW